MMIYPEVFPRGHPYLPHPMRKLRSMCDTASSARPQIDGVCAYPVYNVSAHRAYPVLVDYLFS